LNRVCVLIIILT